MKTKTPEYFKPLLWEYDFPKVDPDKAAKLMVSRAVNYGDLRHWRWIVERYGVEAVRRTLLGLPASAIRPGARALAEIIFELPRQAASENAETASRSPRA
jgi:hypothetical protein